MPATTKHVPDTEVRSEIRSLLVRHRVDLWKLQVRVTSGTVRITGELCYLGSSYPNAPTTLVEGLERELIRSPGVKHTSFDLTNWNRLATGEWKPVEKVEHQQALAGVR